MRALKSGVDTVGSADAVGATPFVEGADALAAGTSVAADSVGVGSEAAPVGLAVDSGAAPLQPMRTRPLATIAAAAR